MQKVKVVINQTVRRYNVSHKGIKFSSATNVVGVGKSAYDIYKETTTDNPILSEVDWIHSLYGEDGITPTIGANGNWFIGNKDTGIVASNGNVVPEKPYFNVPMKCPIPYVGLESEIEKGWSLCDGRNVVGYGVVPDMRGRFIVGADPRTPSFPVNSENNLKNYGAVGNTGGADTVLLTGNQSGVQDHDHPITNIESDNSGASKNALKVENTDTLNTSIVKTAKSGSKNALESHENRPPYYVAAFIIRTSYVNANGGRSAYEIALLNGFIGTEAEWLASLNGKSAYQIALDYGFVGTIEQWILSLKGANGNDGRGIVSIQRTSGNGTAGTTDTYTINYTNDTSSTYQVVNGANGSPGANGRGITSITRTSGNGAAGTTDTYRITYTDNSTTDYTVMNGANGTPGTTLTADQLQIINTVPLVCSDEKTDLTASTDVPVIHFVFQTPQSFTKIVGELNVAASGGTFTVVAKKNGVSFLSTDLTFDSGESTTRTASVPFVFTTPTVSFAVGDYVDIFIISIGSVIAGKGLKIYLM